MSLEIFDIVILAIGFILVSIVGFWYVDMHREAYVERVEIKKLQMEYIIGGDSK